MARIARTGELTPPGMRPTARTWIASEVRVSMPLARGVPPVRLFPLGVVGREVVEPDLLELRRGIEGGAVLPVQGARRGDPVQDRVALLLRAPVGHREDGVRPVGIGRALIAVRDPAHR